MATIENFLLRFKVDGQAAIDRASQSVQKLSNDVQGLGGNLGPLGDKIGGVIGRLGPIGAAAGAAGLAFAALGMRAMQVADQIADISDATGISAGALLNFKSSVLEAGGGADDFGKLAIKLNQTIGEAASGSDKAQKAFRDLGVFVTDAGGNVRSTEAILQDAIRRLAAIEDPSRRAAAAVDLFGKSAASLDVTKLSALRDPVADEDIRRLSEYQASIDRIADSFNRLLLAAAGSISGQIEQRIKEIKTALDEAFQEEQRLNKLGITRQLFSADVGTSPALGGVRTPGYTPEGGFGTRRMTEQEKADLAERLRKEKELADMRAESAREVGRLQRAQQTGGGFGPLPEAERKANAKALAEWEQRLADNVRQTDLQQALRSANEIQAVQLTADTEVAKAREEIFARERLTRQQKEMEFAEKEMAIQSAATNKIQQMRLRANARVYSEFQSQLDEDNKAIAEQEKAYQRGAMAARERVLAAEDVRKAMEDQIMFTSAMMGMSQSEIETYTKINDTIKQRDQAIKDLSKIENLSYADRIAAEARIRAEYAMTIEMIQEQAAAETARRTNFMVGWSEAWAKYKEDAYDSANQAKNTFDTFTSGMEDALLQFVMTGKLSFKDLANSIIADLARIAIKRAIVSAISMFGFANGGTVEKAKPIIVGERGPELFIPRDGGEIISNAKLNNMAAAGAGGGMTNITYNIQAVDAPSFRALVARDPQFIFNVTEAGRRSQPTRRLA